MWSKMNWRIFGTHSHGLRRNCGEIINGRERKKAKTHGNERLSSQDKKTTEAASRRNSLG
jgi:hypothetical protein